MKECSFVGEPTKDIGASSLSHAFSEAMRYAESNAPLSPVVIDALERGAHKLRSSGLFEGLAVIAEKDDECGYITRVYLSERVSRDASLLARDAAAEGLNLLSDAGAYSSEYFAFAAHRIALDVYTMDQLTDELTAYCSTGNPHKLIHVERW